MHRHRSPGNGYRPGSMGMGGVPTSRISPEGSVRGHGMYGSGYRNYNRGFGRGQPKPFQPPQPPPRRGDIFMEAGRLATEYLVSKGFLPPNVLSGKWQNGSLKNPAGDFQYLRAQEGDNTQEGRTSALARLSDSDSVSGNDGRRRFPDDYSSMGTRNYMKGRRRMGSFKGSGSDSNRDFSRSGSWSEKARASPDKDGDDDAFSGYMEQEQAGKDGSNEEQKSYPGDLAPKSDGAGSSESGLETNKSTSIVGLNTGSSVTGKDIPVEDNVESLERGDFLKISDAGTGKVKDDNCNGELEKPSATENMPVQHSAEEKTPANKSGSDLLTLWRFAKVPTKTRSSLTVRGSKIDSVLTGEDENTNESGLSRDSGSLVEDISMAVSPGDAPSDQSQNLISQEPKISEIASMDAAAQQGLAHKVGQGLCTSSISFPERPFISELESCGQLGLGRSSSMVVERGEKRTLQQFDSGEGAKKPREWTPSDAPRDDYLHLSNSRGKQQSSEEWRPSGEEVILAADEKKSIDVSMFSKGVAESCTEYVEEKQLFPGSFKICDLNLMEASDVHDNHESNSMLIFPSISQNNKDAAPVDIDLSMSSNSNITDKHGRRGAEGKEVEVIDLESDSVQDDKAFINAERKDEAIFTGLESFPDTARNVNGIPNAQDGYGLMLSELLDSDIPNCSTVRPSINSMHNEIGLHNGEGILGDDDSIYMSLGEIPISYMQVWDQPPPQDYEKPY